MTIVELLDRYSIPEPNSGCWIWMRGEANGYGVYPWEGRRRQVTHLALASIGVEIPNGLFACHHCDNSLCVNPDHLFVGTQKANMVDAQVKGRLVGYGKRLVCKQGHPLSGENLYLDIPRGKRGCRICRREWGRKVDAKRRPRKR